MLDRTGMYDRLAVVFQVVVTVKLQPAHAGRAGKILAVNMPTVRENLIVMTEVDV